MRVLTTHTVPEICSIGAVIGALTGMLPVVVTIGALLWYTISIWESRTMQGFVSNFREWRARRRERRQPEQTELFHTDVHDV